MQIERENQPITADIFCRVVDNYGDIGVCWRLARRLAHGKGWSVRLWVDDLASFQVLAPAIDTDRNTQHIDGIVVRHWHDQSDARPAQVVIEAFACDPPERYVAAMRQASRPPVWINLEYLSAEHWVEDCHGAASLRPDGLRKNFFFPGFTTGTGGLLREPGLIAARNDVVHSISSRAATLRSLGLPDLAERLHDPSHRCASLFCYPQAPLSALFAGWASSRPARAQTTVCVPTHVAPGVEDLAERHDISVIRMPFFSQTDYDRLLWCMDFNVVRGEDSFVRAIWSGRPMLWHIYPQENQAHMDKLDAWLALAGLPPAVQTAHRLFNRSEDGLADSVAAHAPLQRLADVFAVCFQPDVWEPWQRAAHAHCETETSMSDLADNLADFCMSRLHSS